MKKQTLAPIPFVTMPETFLYLGENHTPDSWFEDIKSEINCSKENNYSWKDWKELFIDTEVLLKAACRADMQLSDIMHKAIARIWNAKGYTWKEKTMYMVNEINVYF